MAFDTWQDFKNFEQEVKFKNRYVQTPVAANFLANVRASLPSRAQELPTGTILYRGQIGYEEFEQDGELVISAYPPARMKPIPNRGAEGRGNPKGISYLYLSSDEETSLSELRPHVGQSLSSAQFKIQRDLRIVDCHSVPEHHSYFQCIFDPPKSMVEIENVIWAMINAAFAKPIVNTEHHSEYASTQILAECFKSEGFDGICFKSSLGSGHNYMLFNLGDAELVNCTVMETKSVAYHFEECTNRYYVRKT